MGQKTLIQWEFDLCYSTQKKKKNTRIHYNESILYQRVSYVVVEGCHNIRRSIIMYNKSGVLSGGGRMSSQLVRSPKNSQKLIQIIGADIFIIKISIEYILTWVGSSLNSVCPSCPNSDSETGARIVVTRVGSVCLDEVAEAVP